MPRQSIYIIVNIFCQLSPWLLPSKQYDHVTSSLPSLVITCFIMYIERWRDRETGRDFPSTASLPRYMQQLSLTQAKAASQELHVGLLRRGGSGPST